jgi:hypothetical protein
MRLSWFARCSSQPTPAATNSTGTGIPTQDAQRSIHDGPELGGPHRSDDFVDDAGDGKAVLDAIDRYVEASPTSARSSRSIS